LQNRDPATFLDAVCTLAVQNVHSGGGPFAAIIVRHGQIIATGVNQVTALHDPTAHAEVQAIRQACAELQTFQLQDCELYSSCEPCPMCFGAIFWARLQCVWYAATQSDAACYGFDDQHIYDQIQLPHLERKIPFKVYSCNQKLAPFLAWQSSQDRTLY
jgi:guanine deaminase